MGFEIDPERKGAPEQVGACIGNCDIGENTNKLFHRAVSCYCDLQCPEQQPGNKQSEQDVESLCGKERPDIFGILLFEYVTKIGFQSDANECQ